MTSLFTPPPPGLGLLVWWAVGLCDLLLFLLFNYFNGPLSDHLSHRSCWKARSYCSVLHAKIACNKLHMKPRHYLHLIFRIGRPVGADDPSDFRFPIVQLQGGRYINPSVKEF